MIPLSFTANQDQPAPAVVDDVQVSAQVQQTEDDEPRPAPRNHQILLDDWAFICK